MTKSNKEYSVSIQINCDAESAGEAVRSCLDRINTKETIVIVQCLSTGEETVRSAVMCGGSLWVKLIPSELGPNDLPLPSQTTAEV